MRSRPLYSTTLLLGLLFFVSGCVPMRFSQYTGQNVDWPQSSGTMVESTYAIPVYRGWPSRPYRLLGSIHHADGKSNWDEGDISAATSLARKRKADAVIIRVGSEFGVSKITGAQNEPQVISTGHLTALAIKWLTDQEIQDERQFEAGLRDWYNRTHPDLQANADIISIVKAYLLTEGVDIHSTIGRERVAATLLSIASAPGENLSGTWIYKASFSTSNMTSSTDDSLIGLASVSVNGANIAIVSRTGRRELNFSGISAQGRVEGSLGIAGQTARCEGATVDDKISISFHSVNVDGVVKGNVVLSRLIRKHTSKQNETTELNSRINTSVGAVVRAPFD